MTKFILIAASMLGTVAGPALANEARPTAATMESATAAAPAQTPRAEPKQRYCVIQSITGSRIAHKVCQTRETWMSEGFDPLAPDR